MKLTTFILLISLMQVSAATFGQRVTLKQKNLTIDKVFREIRKQTGYDVLMGYGDFKASKINANFDNASLTEVMDVVVKNTELTYSIEEKTIVIKRKNASFLEELSNRLNAIDVSGRVVDAKGHALPGASVSVKGKGKSVSTDAQGNFYLNGVDEDVVLIISFIGYVSKEVKATKELGDIVMEFSTSKLDEVQVIAYGTTTRRLSTSNITTIKGEEIDKQPISNVLMGLQGRAPGIYLGQATGLAGGDVKVRVQGENSLRKGNEAFYVIDGIPYTPQNLYSGIIGGAMPSSGSTLNFLNPADIESIEILKDADATAIYGSRAANGAILITTKKGRTGRTKVDLNAQSGVGHVSSKVDLLNTQQYLEMRNEAFLNANSTPGPTDFDVNGIWDQNRNTDWQKELIGNSSHYTNLQASISGGTSETQFSAGGGYIKETTVFPGDFSDSKGNVRMSINHKSKDRRFEFNISTNYLEDLNKLPTTDLTNKALVLPPNAPALYNSDGSVNWEFDPNNNNNATFTSNPAILLLNKYRAKTNNLLGNSLIGYEILPDLMLKTTLGYNKLEVDEINTVPQTFFNPANTVNSRTAKYGTKNITSWILEPQLTYTKNFSFGNIDALVGSSFQSTNNSVVAYNGSEYPDDSQLENSLAAGKITPNSSTMQSQYRYNAIFGRLNYQLKNKYIVNISIRRDGSSRFGSENLFHTFYSMGGAWIISDENWFKTHLESISFAKFRVTYGTTGNDQISDYQFLNLYSSYSSNVQYPYQQSVGLLPTGHSNPYIQWEETKKLNFGIDIGFFNNKILINSNIYRNRSSNQLLGYNLPFLSGFATVLRNIPATIQNSGFEFQVESSPVNNQGFKWQLSANMTIPKNKLIKYPNLEETSDAYNYIIGESPSILKVFEYAGVDKESGLYEFKTKDGNLSTSPDALTDRTKFVDLNPRFYGGIVNSFKFNNFDFSFLFQFVKKKAMNYKFGAFWPGIMTNQPASILNRWKQIGDVKEIQRVSTGFDELFSYLNATNASDASFSDASFVRLKTANISYSLPSSLTNKYRLSGVRIYLQGQNLLTFTKYESGDPEIGNVGILPTLRVITAGIQLTF